MYDKQPKTRWNNWTAVNPRRSRGWVKKNRWKTVSKTLTLMFSAVRALSFWEPEGEHFKGQIGPTSNYHWSLDFSWIISKSLVHATYYLLFYLYFYFIMTMTTIILTYLATMHSSFVFFCVFYNTWNEQESYSLENHDGRRFNSFLNDWSLSAPERHDAVTVMRK